MKSALLTLTLLATPCWAQTQSQEIVTVAVLSINDFHARLLPEPHLNVPGAPALVETLDSLKRVYPYHITVSAGDNFGGCFFYNATRASSLLPQAYKDMGINISAVGNHEFDEGQAALADKWNKTYAKPGDWDIQYVTANVRNRSNQVPEFAQPFIVRSIPLSKDKSIDVGFVGLTTAATPWQASIKRLEGLSFSPNYRSTLDSVATLPGYERFAKAPIRVLLTHIGTDMKDGQPVWDDPAATDLAQLDRKDIDAVLSAHSHTMVVGMSPSRRSIPITQSLCYGRYVSVLKCEIEAATGRLLKITPELVRVNPNIRLSYKAARLKAQLDEQLHTSFFRGKPLSQVLTHCTKDIVNNRKLNKSQTRMGSLVTESYATAYRKAQGLADDALVVGVSHFGSIRAGLPAGEVTVLKVGEALPFANPLRAYRYTGQQLLALMEHGINVCKLGRIQTSGVQAFQDKSGKVRRLSLTLPNGKVVPITAKTKLVVVADEYMTTGGDGYLPEQFPKTQEIKVALPTSTDAFLAYLPTLSSI